MFVALGYLCRIQSCQKRLFFADIKGKQYMEIQKVNANFNMLVKHSYRRGKRRFIITWLARHTREYILNDSML